jgi:hypothetical protein
MTTLGPEKGESSRNRGPSGQSTEVQFRQTPAAAARSGFRTNPAHQDSSDNSRTFSEFLDQPGYLSPANAAESVDVEQRAIPEAQATDGLAVVDLLSRPDDDITMATEPSLEHDMSPATIESLRAALFETNDHAHPVSWDSLLNFTPDYVLKPTEGIDNATSHFGTSEAQTLNADWLQQWGQVLTSYTDNVWGDLLPLITQARREHETLSQEDSTDISKPLQALNRLRMILAHVQNSGSQR